MSLRHLAAVLATVIGCCAVVGSARASRNDLDLLKLCSSPPPGGGGLLIGAVSECNWVKRQPGTGLITGVTLDADAEVNFRSLMSELGAVMAPRLVMPAETLGFAGFQISGELGTTSISNDKPYWKGVSGVSAQNAGEGRPDAWLTTVGMFVRKGLWLPLPAVEVGGGFMHLLDSQLVSWQGYAKLALHEGFHDWPIPSFGVRASASYLTGTDQVRMTTTGIDLIASKGFGVMGTARLDFFGGWSFLFIHAQSGIIDATPSCDATATQNAKPGDKLSEYCAAAQRGTPNDAYAYFSFADQDTITRQRFFGGVKVKFATVFLAAEYQLIAAGRSRDERKANGARDDSERQSAINLSGGFDF